MGETPIIVGVIGLIIILIYALYVTARTAQEKDQEEQEEQKETPKEQEGIILGMPIIHIGGNPYLRANRLYWLQISKKDISFFASKNDFVLDVAKCNRQSYYTVPVTSINIDQILKYELKSEAQVQQSVTIPRLLLLGPLAFAAKKTETINNECLHLSYMHNGVAIDCLFKNAVQNQGLGEIISAFNRLKIKGQK